MSYLCKGITTEGTKTWKMFVMVYFLLLSRFLPLKMLKFGFSLLFLFDCMILLVHFSYICLHNTVAYSLALEELG